MANATTQVFTGNGATTQYPVNFPFISPSHVNVYVNEALQLDPLHYTLSGSTVTFETAPGLDAAIVIQRSTSPANILVDFQDGSVLRESDLDTAYLHNFYLSQEYAENFNALINSTLLDIASDAGIVETETDAIIAALVNEMLNTSQAAVIQQRVNDIDANAEAIITLGDNLQVQINTLASGVAAEVYIQDDEPVPGVSGIPDPITEGARWYDSDDNNHPYIYESSAWVSIEDPRVGNAVADIAVLQTDVATNAAAVVTESLARSTQDTAFASELALIGAQNGAQDAFIIDTSTVKIDSDSGDTFAARFAALTAEDATNAASVVTEQVARIAADAVIAGDVTTLTTTVDGHTASIATQTTSIDGLEARYSVEVNVDGHVSGFILNSDDTRSDFVVLADNFSVVNPGFADVVPFTVSGGAVQMQNVEINGSLMINGSIVGAALANGTIGSTQIGANAITTTQLNANAVTADKIQANTITAAKMSVTDLAAITADLGSITAGNITLDTSGYIQGGQTAYNTGDGFFLGYDTDEYKFSIGDGSTNFLTWDGNELIVRGNVSIGTYTASNDVILAANTERQTSNLSFTTLKTFAVNKPGTIRVDFESRMGSTIGGVVNPMEWRIMRDGVQQFAGTISSSSYVAIQQDVTTTESTSNISIEIMAGERNTIEPLTTDGFIRNATLSAVIGLGESVTLD